MLLGQKAFVTVETVRLAFLKDIDGLLSDSSNLTELHDAQKGATANTKCKTLSALWPLGPGKGSRWSGTYLHRPLTAPPLFAGTAYSRRFVSVEQSSIFLNT